MRPAVEIDLDTVLGGGKGDKSKPPKGAMPMGEDEPPASERGEEMGESEELPPGFADAADEFLDVERPIEERHVALFRAIKACSGEGY